MEEEKKQVEIKQPETLGPAAIIAIVMTLGITITNVVSAYMSQGKFTPVGYGTVIWIIFFFGIGWLVKMFGRELATQLKKKMDDV